MNKRPVSPTPDPGTSQVVIESGGAQPFPRALLARRLQEPIICGTVGCYEETDGGYYCHDCEAAYAELADDEQWLDEQRGR